MAILAMAALLAFAVSSATAKDENANRARATLDSYQETPKTLSTTGHGQFMARIHENSIDYTLTYADLEGGAAFAAHIHLGRPALTGGVSAFLCGGGTKPPCPPQPATVSGTIVATDVLGPADQGIAPTEFDELVRAIRAEATYVNVHTPTYGGGEIRGRVRVNNEGEN